MALGNLTLYPALPLWGRIPACSMPSDFKLNKGIKNNLAGQYMSGDTIFSVSTYRCQESFQQNQAKITADTIRFKVHESIAASNGAMAWLLIPSNLFNAVSQYNKLELECINERYNQTPYSYRAILMRNQAQTNSQTAIKHASIVINEDGTTVKGYPTITESTGITGSNAGNQTFRRWIETELMWEREINNAKYYDFPPDVTLAINTQVTTLMAKYNDFNSVLMAINTTEFFRALYTGNQFTAALQISSSLPIFQYTQLEELYQYFKFGDASGALNDLDISEVDFATHWKIYVNGQRRPNIYVTMDSPDIDNYLANSAENTGGYNKEDFKIQYRIPTWAIDMASILIGKDVESSLKEYELVNDTTDTYNNTRSSSWEEITDRNYRNKSEFPTFSGQGMDNKRFYEMYAQLQFRVYLTENLYSAWCDFGIGYIGSPSVPDFALMQNWGNVVSIDDGSTVELIYDQLPDDIDDYEEPDDDFPPDGDTDPTGLSLDSALTTTYRITLDQLQLLGKYLWGASFFDDIKLINNSPIENIVSCKKLPFTVNVGVARNVVLGNVVTPVNGNIVSSMPIIDIGTITYNGYYGNFLDYSPYTQLIMFLPFCGFVNIDASAVTGKTLNVKYVCDIILGKCKALIYLDGAYYMSVDGDLGIDIPLVASNRAQAESAFALQGIEAVAQGDLMGVLGAAVSTQYHSSRNGSYTPTCAWQETRKCYLIADIPTVQYPSSYGHDVGYPCMLTRTLATLSGFTVCSEDIDMSGFNCTSEEMDMIKQILTTGIYL